MNTNAVETILSLTPMQRGIYFESIIRTAPGVYVDRFRFSINGVLDTDLFKGSWEFVFKQNELLRAKVKKDKHGQPLLVIYNENPDMIRIFDLTGNIPEEALAKAEYFCREGEAQAANLEQLFMVQLFLLGPNRYRVDVIYHHLICDGWSNGIVLREFFKFYKEGVTGKQDNVICSKPRYSEYVKWIQEQDTKAALSSWQEILKDLNEISYLAESAPPVSVVGTDCLRRFYLTGPSSLNRSLEDFYKENRTTAGTFFPAVWALLLSRYLNCDDVIFGMVTTLRPPAIKHIENLVGLCINTLPFPVHLHRRMEFVTLLQKMEQLSRLITLSGQVTLPEIKGTTGITRQLFDHLLIVENYPINELLKTFADEFQNTWHFDGHFARAHYDLLVAVMPGEEFSILFEYNENTFDGWYIEQMGRHLLGIIETVLGDHTIETGKIDFLSGEEKHQLLYEFNEPVEISSNTNIINRYFCQQVHRIPHYNAIVFNNIHITYHELAQRSTILAGEIIGNGNSGCGIVGILAERSIELIAGLLGILKAGYAYLPLDPYYPSERIRYMLADSNTIQICAQEKWLHLLTGSKPEDIIILNQPLPIVGKKSAEPVSSGSRLPAYVMYTSGSTGKPKGVMIEHRHVIRLVDNPIFIELRTGERLLMTGAPAFDITTFEIWSALLNGLTLYLAEETTILNPALLKEAVIKNNISILHLIPQLFNRIPTEFLDLFSVLRYFLVGGDLVNPFYIEELRTRCPKLEICHMYGPTENTTFSTFFPVKRSYEKRIPLGYPINHTQIFLFGCNERLQPVGVPGEIHVGGNGLARGYLNHVELSREKFKIIPGCITRRLFASGDLGRWLPGCCLEFLGRRDHQVKIRGQRVELGEIESVLRKYPSVTDVVIITIKDASGENALCAYIVTPKTINIGKLREHAGQQLPGYMIPGYFIFLEHLPLTPNGKLDRSALPAPVVGDLNGDIIAPENEIELLLLEIWREVLGINKINVMGDFFEIGGHSLKAMTLLAKVHERFNVRIGLRTFFTQPTIRQLARVIKQSEANLNLQILNVERKEYYPLSSNQKRLYFLNRMKPEITVYNLPAAYKMSGAIDCTQLEEVFVQLLKRHEALRTSFVEINGIAVQKIHDTVTFQIEENVLSEEHIPEAVREFIRPFDLALAPLIRVGLLRLSGENTLFLVDVHHIIVDGYSIERLTADFMTLYNGGHVSPLKIQYTDFSEMQRQYTGSGEINKQGQYWMNRFSGDLPVLNLPTEIPRPPVLEFTGASIFFSIEQEMVRQLSKLAVENNVTVYMVLLAVFNVLLFRYTGQEDIVIGTPVAGRSYGNLENTIGMFANTLALRNFLTGENSFIDFLSEVKQVTLEAFENQDYPLEELIERLNVPRQLNRNPLFDVMFALQENSRPQLKIPGISIEPFELYKPVSKFDLTLFATVGEGIIEFQLEYSNRLFTANGIKRMAERLIRIIAEVIPEPGIKIKEIQLLGHEEKEFLLHRFNNSEMGSSDRRTVQEMFASIATGNPWTVALVHNNSILTYHRLKRMVDRVGMVLLEKGVGGNEIVGIFLDPSPIFVMAVLGVLSLGAAYLPMDTNFPGDRCNYMLRNIGSRFVITSEETAREFFPGAEIIYCDELRSREINETDTVKDLPVRGQSADNAYVIYTSGSTGLPKGCLITQQGLVNYVEWAIRQYYSDKFVYFPLYSSVAFDLTVTSIFTPLLSGNAIAVYPNGLNVLETICRDPLCEIIKLTPTHLRLFVEMDLVHCRLQTIIAGGEQLSSQLAQAVNNAFNGRVTIYNEYGPTETVVGCMIHRYNPGDEKRIAVPIGVPAGNVHIYILDRFLNPSPLGISGELYIGGARVSPGYVNQPELTNRSFIVNPFEGGRSGRRHRLYKSGDLGVFLENGKIEYIGRKDAQVKIRGYRIELGEIEQKLKEYPGIHSVLVRVARDEGSESYLCAYIVYKEAPVEDEILKQFLAADLPVYMIPQFFISMDSFPLLKSGKIDERSLPLLSEGKKNSGKKPENSIQKFLYTLWKELLPMKTIDIHDNFFEVGGNSFLLLQMHQRVSRKYSQIQVTDYFKYTSIKAMAAYISSKEDGYGKKQLEMQIQMPEELFNGWAYNSVISTTAYSIDLPDNVIYRLNRVADEAQVTIQTVFITLFAAVLADTGDTKNLNMQTRLENRQMYSLLIDLNLFDQLESLFKFIHRELTDPKDKQCYHLADLLPVEMQKKKHSIIPCIGQCLAQDSERLSKYYDIFISIEDERNTEGGMLICHFNDRRLKAEKVETMLHLYSGLLENLGNPVE